MIDTIYTQEPKKMIIWDLGRRCNYDCSYCTAWMHSTDAPFNTLDKFKKTAKFINDYYQFHKQYHKVDFKPLISFTGGEPAINPDFFPLIQHIHEEYPDLKMSLTTNGTWGPKKGEMILQYIHSVTVSYHAEGNDKQKNLVRKNLLWLKSKYKEDWRLKVNVMMHVDYWDECVDLIENFLKPNEINFIPRVIGDDGMFKSEWFKDIDGKMRRTSHEYSKEQLEYLKTHWDKKNKSVGDNKTKINIDKTLGKTA